jgi:hypothetical protein
MKKTLIAALLVLMITLLAVGPAAAKKDKLNVKGEVSAVGGGSVTVETKKGETYVIGLPEGIEPGAIQVGDAVLIKAVAGEDGGWKAVTVKVIGKGDDVDDDDDGDEIENGDDDDDDGNGGKGNSAFCAADKQVKPHPLAPKLAERYGVSEEMVMGYFCEGYSIGAIMLAIKTSQIEGTSVDVGTLLAGRDTGKGWGLIWKELGLIGSEKQGHSPPG